MGYRIERLQQIREERRSKGLCPQCGKILPEDGLKICFGCRIKKRDEQKRLRVKKSLMGLCRCGKVVVEGKAQCQDCLDALKQYHSRTYPTRKGYYPAQRFSIKMLVWSAYGGPKCSCCGETNFEFLSIDHINGGGNQHRKKVTGRPQGNIYRWLIRQNFPSGFRVLCFNCNMSIGFYGYCPHEVKDVEEGN